MNCTCDGDQFQCADGRCIENRWRCGKWLYPILIPFWQLVLIYFCILNIDGWNDCLDGSDEAIELCAGKNQLQKIKIPKNKKNFTETLLFQPFHADTMRSDATTKDAFESQISAMVSMIVAAMTIPMKLPVHFITNARQSNSNAKATDTAFQSILSVMVNHNVLVNI